MTIDRTELIRALAYYTRLGRNEANEAPSLPSREAAVIIRSLMAIAYALCGGIASWLAHGRLAGHLVGAVVIILAHLWLTNGRDLRRPLEFIPRPGASSTADEARQGIVTIALLLPAVAVLALVLAGGCYAIIPVMAIGTAIGCEMTSADAAPTPFSLRQPRCWGIALLASWLPSLLFAGSMAGVRSSTLRLLLLSLVCLLLTPWLRSLSSRPSGRAASILLGEGIASIIYLLIACF